MKTLQLHQKIIGLLAVLGFGLLVHAGQMTQAELDLLDFQAHCNTQYCDAGYGQKVVFDIKTPEKVALDLKTKAALEARVYEQAQVWGDTILEGDYVADGETKIARVEALYRGEYLAGYRVVYFEKAWWVGECDHDVKNLAQCLPGYIEEAAFITNDLKVITVDEAETALFKEQIQK